MGNREIAFDTETTGFDARGDDRLTEIGCVELIDFLPTGKTWHTYINPERDVPERVTEITGLTTEFLNDKPLFADVAEGFRDFVGESPLIAHNASFDRGFINAELARLDYDPYPGKRFIDTLMIAREKFPGASNSLDALCRRFDISLASRSTHGALVDAHLLAKVYLELRGGKERSLAFRTPRQTQKTKGNISGAESRPVALCSLLSKAEEDAHQAFVKKELGENAIWLKYKDIKP